MRQSPDRVGSGGAGHATGVVAKALCSRADASGKELGEHRTEKREVAVTEVADERTDGHQSDDRSRTEGEDRNDDRSRDHEEREGRTAAKAIGDPAEGD